MADPSKLYGLVKIDFSAVGKEWQLFDLKGFLFRNQLSTISSGPQKPRRSRADPSHPARPRAHGLRLPQARERSSTELSTSFRDRWWRLNLSGIPADLLRVRVRAHMASDPSRSARPEACKVQGKAHVSRPRCLSVVESPGLALDPSECGALASIPNVELVRDLPAPSEGVTLLMLPGAEADCARVAAAIDVLTRNDDLAGVVEIAADEPGYSLAYDLALSPERVNAMLIQNDALVALALGDMRSLHLAQAAVAAACALELSRSPLLVSAPSPPVDAAVWGREAIRSFAVEELFPQLREGGSEREYHELLIEFAAKLLEKGRLGDGFALGAYAEKIGEGRDPGSRSRLYTPRGAPPAGATSAGETSDPLVSVIIPTRNRPALLARAVESVAMQSVDDVEVIVVNDGGDEPGPVLAPYREAFRAPGRMLVVSQMPGRGPSAARNLGLRLARGRYVGFLDDDDRLLPHHLAALLPALQGGARVVHADARSIDERPAHPLPCTQRIRLHYQFRYEPFHFLIENSFPIQSTLCERQLLLVAGGWDETLTMLEDWDLWLRVFSLASPVRVARVTSEVHRLLGGESLSANPDGEWLEAQAYVYGKTIDREHQLPQLRCARVQHLVARAREFGVLFPRRAADWLRGDARLQPIDPDHPEEFAFDPVLGMSVWSTGRGRGGGERRPRASDQRGHSPDRYTGARWRLQSLWRSARAPRRPTTTSARTGACILSHGESAPRVRAAARRAFARSPRRGHSRQLGQRRRETRPTR